MQNTARPARKSHNQEISPNKPFQQRKVAMASLKFAFVIHRGLGCDDESATEEEQAEKILFYHPLLTSTNEQLNKINMIEGLIDFASKFSVDPISTVVMQEFTWAFFECEKDVWIIIACDSQINPSAYAMDSGLVYGIHQSNTYAMEASLRNMYTLYCMINGGIRRQLGNFTDDNNLISVVKVTRKKIRKIHLRLRQEQQDLQSLISREKDLKPTGSEDLVEHMGIRANTKTIQEVGEEIDKSNQEIKELTEKLDEALNHPGYSYVNVRKGLTRFMMWYIDVGQMEIHTALEGMKGMRLLQPYYPDPVLHTINAYSTISSMGSAATFGGIGDLAGNSTNTGTGIPCAGSVQSGLQSTLGSAAFSSSILRIRHSVEEATQHKTLGTA